MDKSTLYNVRNRSAGSVSYNIPEDRINRYFAAGEIKQISEGELEKLSYQPGGRLLMLNYLQIDDIKVVNDLNIPAEQEYWYSEKEIVDLLTSGTLDQLLDCLDFAPSGVIDLLKKFAVELPVNDFQKRKAIFEKTGFNVTSAISNIEIEKDNSKETKAVTSQRRVNKKEVVEEEKSTERRSKSNEPSTRKEVKEALTPIVKTVKIIKKDEE